MQDKNTLKAIFHAVYFVFLGQIYFVLTSLVGLVIGGFLPALILIFRFFHQGKKIEAIARMREVRWWIDEVIPLLRRWCLVSVGYVLVFVMLVMNISYFIQVSQFWAMYLVYLSIFICILVFIQMVWLAFLVGQFPDKSFREIWNNAWSYTWVRSVDNLVVAVLIVALNLFMWDFLLPLWVVGGVGLSGFVLYHSLGWLLKGRTLGALTKDWRNKDPFV